MSNWKMISLIIVIGLSLVFAIFYIDTDASLDEKLCDQITKMDLKCEKIYDIDTEHNLIFYKSDSFIKIARTEEDSLKVVEIITMHPLEMQEEAGFQWSGFEHPNYSFLWGIHTDEIGLIKIKSENNIQPNRIKIEDNTWLWYSFFDDRKINPPEQFSVYDNNGKIINSIK